MYRCQQLSPLVRRIHVSRPDAADEEHRLPDPALGDWGRARIAAELVQQHATLAEALEGCPVPLVELGYDADGGVRIRIALEAGEHLYGAYDADANGLDRRGEHVHLTNEIHPRGQHLMAGACDHCDAIELRESPGLAIGDDSSNYGELLLPLVLSSRGWGIYVSNAWHGAVLDLGDIDPDAVTYTAPGGHADVYLLGPGADAGLLASEFVRLTGQQPLPPTWALGFLQSRFGYESFDHVHEVLDRFQTEQLPVHGVIFDVQWLEDHVNLRWNPQHFPDPAGNLARIAQRGVRSMVITEPGTRAGASNHRPGVERSAFATDEQGSEFDSEQWYAQRGIDGYREIAPSTGALLNVFKEDAADWWYDQHRALLDQGVDAWWLDLNEPEDVTADVCFPNVDWPATRALVRGEEVRNSFAIAQQRLFARRDRAHTSRRPFVLTRSGSAGSQRYGAAPWTGDVGATWEDLRVQPRLTLLAGICGIALHGSDIGGFNGDPGPELFTRWMQLGAVSPIFRAHGCMLDREPWSQGEDALAAIRPSLLLRAQLLPSIATWAWQALRAGQPLARPMLLGPLGTSAGSEDAAAWASDPRWQDVDDQFWFGPLLAAPVLEEGATTRRVTLPDGEWIDLWSGARHTGGGAIEVPAPLDALPLFLSARTALVVDPEPLAGRGQSWPPSELEVWSWARGDEVASCELYLDDGITRMHEQGAYCLQHVAVDGAGELMVERRGGAWPASRVRVATPAPGQCRTTAS